MLEKVTQLFDSADLSARQGNDVVGTVFVFQNLKGRVMDEQIVRLHNACSIKGKGYGIISLFVEHGDNEVLKSFFLLGCSQRHVD